MSLQEEKCNGWTNWDTWNANLWLTNDEWTSSKLRIARSPEMIEVLWNDYFEGTDGIDTSHINFLEIFRAYEGDEDV